MYLIIFSLLFQSTLFLEILNLSSYERLVSEGMCGAENSTVNFWDTRMTTIEEFRSRVTQFLVKDYMKTDVYLARYLKVCEFDVQCAFDMIENSYKWRIENNINEIIDEDLEVHQRYFDYTIQGLTLRGDPIIKYYFGKWDFLKYVMAGKRDLVLRCWFQMMERMEQKLYECALNQTRGQTFHQVYAVIDTEGYSLRKQGCFGCIEITTHVIKTQGHHYPAFFRNLTVINAPRILGPLLAIVKSVASSDTAQTIREFGAQRDTWLPHIFRDIGPDLTLKLFGGD